METKILRLTREDIDHLLDKERLYYGVESFDCDFCSNEKEIKIEIQLNEEE